MSRKKSYIPILAAATMALGLMAAGCGSGSDEGDENGNVKVFVPMVALGDMCPAPVQIPEGEAVIIPQGTKVEEGTQYLVLDRENDPNNGAWVNKEGALLDKCELAVTATWFNGDEKPAPTRVFQTDANVPVETSLNLPSGTEIMVSAALNRYSVTEGGFGEPETKYGVDISGYKFDTGNLNPELILYLNEKIDDPTDAATSIHFKSLSAIDSETGAQDSNNFDVTTPGATIAFTVTLDGQSESITKMAVEGQDPGNNCGSWKSNFAAVDGQAMTFTATWATHPSNPADVCILKLMATGSNDKDEVVEQVSLPVRVTYNGGSDGVGTGGKFFFNAAPKVTMGPTPQISLRDLDQELTVKVTATDEDSLAALQYSLTQTSHLRRAVPNEAAECLVATVGEPAVDTAAGTAEFKLSFPEGWTSCDGLANIDDIAGAGDKQASITLQLKVADPAPTADGNYGADLEVIKNFRMYVIDPVDGPITQE